MKIEIDFDRKVIVLRDNTSLTDLVTQLKKLRINWKEFTIAATEVKTETIPWTTPYTPQPYQPWQPTYDPYKVTCYMDGSELGNVLTIMNEHN